MGSRQSRGSSVPEVQRRVDELLHVRSVLDHGVLGPPGAHARRERDLGGGTQLSATDKDYIGKWYPFPVTPTNADGLLRTGDDCDEIDFLVEYNAVGANEVEFHLAAASGIDWWKAIEVPTGGGDYRMLEIQDGSSKTEQITHSDLDASRPVRFWKAKTFGVHTRLGYTWDVISALPGGSRVSLTWKRDRC